MIGSRLINEKYLYISDIY